MSKEYILVVDDSKFINKGLSHSIEENCGIEVLSAFSFADTKNMVKKYGKQIIFAVVDLHLPDSDNGETVDYTLENKIPSIVLTGDFSENIRIKLLKKNIADFFLKENSDSINIVTYSIKRLLKNRITKVLIVDDSKLYLSLFEDILKKQMFEPLFARDGEEAYKIIRENSDIKLVITDYNMPKMDGLELTQKIRKLHSKDEIAILVLSGSEDRNTTVRFLKYGANDFITKPFIDEELTTRISSNLEILDLFQESRDRANKDFMTGMFNRRYFFDEGTIVFNKARKEQKNNCVAMFDIDKFKNINDTYGHDIGDIAIKEVAKILANNLDQHNSIISRFGGEEFCVILTDLKAKEALEVFENIRKEFESNIIKVDEITFSYTVSTGVCFTNDCTLDEAVKGSDKCLYIAKDTGRNKVISDL